MMVSKYLVLVCIMYVLPCGLTKVISKISRRPSSDSHTSNKQMSKLDKSLSSLTKLSEK